MKYFELMFNYEKYDGATCLMTKDIQGINQYIFDEGKKIDKWQDFSFYYNPDEANEFIDYQGNELGWFIISSRFKKIIEDLGSEGVQFLPIKIINEKDNSVNTDYFVVNFISHIEGAFDFTNSIYVGEKPTKDKIAFEPARFYAIRENSIKNYHVFKLKECPMPFFISEILKKTIEKNNIKGCSFKKTISL